MKNILFLTLSIFLYTIHASASCEPKNLEFRDADFKIQVSKFQAKGFESKSILIIPPTGGTNFIDRSYAEYFCDKGFDVIILNRWSEDDEYNLDLEIHERFYQRGQRAIGLALYQIHTKFVGILGTSVGALHVSNAMQRFSRLNAAFLIVGGLPISDVTANSDQEVLIKVRKERIRMYGFKNNNEYAQALHKTLSFDFPRPSANPNLKIGMVTADNDLTVPTKNQLIQERAYRPSTVIRSQGGHVYVVLKAWLFQKDEILKFFKTSIAR